MGSKGVCTARTAVPIPADIVSLHGISFLSGPEINFLLFIIHCDRWYVKQKMLRREKFFRRAVRGKKLTPRTKTMQFWLGGEKRDCRFPFVVHGLTAIEKSPGKNLKLQIFEIYFFHRLADDGDEAMLHLRSLASGAKRPSPKLCAFIQWK
ncbi:MAG: hypothetical protein IJS96_06300 [Schwartzia sp.]|nr:hypothetical protein [Schwartzia sp. (in: firmicutes)]